MQQVARHEYTEPMSWARALLLAVGMFFVTAILLGQLPGYVYTVTTLAKLTTFEQGFWSLGLLFVGFGTIGMVLLMLYDPKPVLSPKILLGVGVILGILGLLVLSFATLADYTFFPQPSQTFASIDNGIFLWLQASTLDIVSLGIVLLGTGVTIALYSWFAPTATRKELPAEKMQFIALISGGIAGVIVALYVVLYTFLSTVPQGATTRIIYDSSITSFLGGQFNTQTLLNILLSIAALLAFLAVQLWFLPVLLTEKRKVMPGAYLISVNFLAIGFIFLLVWLLVYPIVTGIHALDASQIFVSCSQKKQIPASCTFTAYTGYIVAAIFATGFLQILLMGIYFWTSHRQAVVYGGSQLLLMTAFAAIVTHTSGAGLPTALFIGTAIVLLALTWLYTVKHEIAPVGSRNLGCTGQWLVVGTALLIYLAGFSFFSLIGNNFFESESLGVYFNPGMNYDAFWAFLITAILAAIQFFYLLRNRYKL